MVDLGYEREYERCKGKLLLVRWLCAMLMLL